MNYERRWWDDKKNIYFNNNDNVNSITAVAEDHNYIYKSDIRTYIDNQEITS